MALVALATLAVLRAPPGDPKVQGFFDLMTATFEVAENCEGFVSRSARDPITGRHSWGEAVPPRFIRPNEQRGTALTLSLRASLEAVVAFTYAGIHGEALRQRLDWCLPPRWPTYAAWWVPEGHTPDFREASERIEHLHDRGSTPHAFDFKVAFGSTGAPMRIDRDRVREIVGRTAA